MTNAWRNGLLQATRLTTGSRLAEATASLQRMLQGSLVPGGTDLPGARRSVMIDGVAGTIAPTGAAPSPEPAPTPSPTPAPHSPGAATPSTTQPAPRAVPEAMRHFLGQALGGLTSPRLVTPGPGMPGRGMPGPGMPGLTVPGEAAAASSPPAGAPDGAQFLTKTFSNQAGSRRYKLYVPAGYHGQSVPLVVMLHGCTQSPDDFAAGTRMNEAAEEHLCLVAYPEQSAAANPSRCWNWFNAADQQRDQGEPSLIAGITRAVMDAYAIDPRRVYVAGLSAGGAFAAVMGAAYPDLYAAIGVHSGLASGAASDMISGLAAMRRGKAGPGAEPGRRVVPAIVFHGDRDTTVHPGNGDAVIAQATPDQPWVTRVQDGQVPGGHAYRRTLHCDASGKTVLEHWVVRGAGHAWSGGNAAGSFTDPLGPDASREMLRFFAEQTGGVAQGGAAPGPG